jgi:hypothetical protein
LIGKDEGTEVTLTHCGFPVDQGEHLSIGWDENYIKPLLKRFS